MDTKYAKSLGYVIMPEVWIDSAPARELDEPEYKNEALEELLCERIENEAADLQVRVARDGAVWFGFERLATEGAEVIADWKPNLAEHCLPAERLVNAHLALLSIARATDRNLQADQVVWRHSIAGRDLWRGFLTAGGKAGAQSSRSGSYPLMRMLLEKGLELPKEVFPWLGPFPTNRGETIPIQVVEKSLNDLRVVLEEDDWQRRAVVLELLGKSLEAKSERDLDWAMVVAWTGIEALLQESFTCCVDERIQPDSALSGRRRHTLGRLSAEQKMTVLTLLDKLPIELFENARAARLCRDAWIHRLKHSSEEDSDAAIRTLTKLVTESYGVG